MFTGLTRQLNFGNYLIGEIIPEDHELVKLKKIIDWEKMNKIYSECYRSKKGNATKRSDTVLGLFILRHLYRKPYRIMIDELHVNLAYMDFCSVSSEEIIDMKRKGKRIIDHSSLIKIKQRIGHERFERIVKIFTRELIEKGFIDGRYMFSDTTSLEKNIIYPTDVSLLKRVIEEAEAVVQKVRYKKEIIKSEVIKKADQISKIYYSSSKKTKEMLQATCKELVQIAEKTVKKAGEIIKLESVKSKKYLVERYEKIKEVGEKIIQQTKEYHLDGKKIHDRIVNYYEDHARSLPKGKVGKPVEFGDKLRIDMSGNGYVTNYKLYTGNPSEITMLEESIEKHKNVFKEKFRAAGFDRAFYDESKIDGFEKEYNVMLAIPHKKDRSKPMGKRKEKIYNRRSAIEAKISEGKRMCGLNKSLYRGFEGDLIWTSLGIFALNIRKLLRDISLKPKLIERFV
jgi:transposase, IS5 family